MNKTAADAAVALLGDALTAVGELLGPPVPDPVVGDGQADLRVMLEQVGAGLAFVGNTELAPLAATCFELAHRLQGLGAAVTREAATRGVHQETTKAVDPATWLIETCGVAAVEAAPVARLIKAGNDVAKRGLVADALTGGLSVREALAGCASVDRVRHDLPSSMVTDAAEGVRYLMRAGAKSIQLRSYEEQLLSNFSSADPEQRDECRRAKRGFNAFTPLPDGMFRSTLTLDPESFAVLTAALDALSAPRVPEPGAGDPVAAAGAAAAAGPEMGAGNSGDSAADGAAGGSQQAGGGDHSSSHSACDHSTCRHVDDPEAAQADRDTRSAAQRRADALVEMARLVTGIVPTGPMAAPTSVVVTLRLEDLLAGVAAHAPTRPGRGHTPSAQPSTTSLGASPSSGPDDVGSTTEPSAPSWGAGVASSSTDPPDARLLPGSWAGLARDGFGTALSPAVARRLACDAEVIPVVLGSAGEPLDVGRARRLATAGQRAVLAIRDGGCPFPTCTAPIAWTRAHHVVHWADGGPTDLTNLALLCDRHHRLVHARGFTATVTVSQVRWHVRPGNHQWIHDPPPGLADLARAG